MPSDTLFTKKRPPASPWSTRRSTPSTNASSAEPGIGPVEVEVEGEVVAGAGRDADERQVVGDGHRGHVGLRAVAAGHAQHLGTVGHRAPRPAR